MLTSQDLQAIDKLITKRILESELRVTSKLTKYIDIRITKTEAKLKRYFTKLFNFLDKDVMDLKGRVKKLEDNAHYS